MADSLHEVIGDLVEEISSTQCTVFRSPECGGEHTIPLHCLVEGTSETEYCMVDIAIVKNGEVRVIIEIEESNVRPVQIFGKFLASAMSSYFIHGERAIIFPIADSVLFVQILNTSELNLEETSKLGQWDLVKGSVNETLRSIDTKVAEYVLMSGDIADFKSGEERARMCRTLEKAVE